jgi:hypothetical protein
MATPRSRTARGVAGTLSGLASRVRVCGLRQFMVRALRVVHLRIVRMHG